MAMTTHLLHAAILLAFQCLNTLVAGSGIRLYGGPSSDKGYVQVKVGTEWRSICNYDWDALDAMVTCRQLGFTDGYAMIWKRDESYGLFTDRSVDILDIYTVVGNNFACKGGELSLMSCSYKTQYSKCRHRRAGVACNVTSAQFYSLLSNFLDNYGHGGDPRWYVPTDTENSAGPVIGAQSYGYYTQELTMLTGGVCDMDERSAMLICENQGYHNGGKAIKTPLMENLPMMISKLSCNNRDWIDECDESYTLDGTCPNSVQYNSVQCYTSLRPSVVGALSFGVIGVVVILIACSCSIHRITRSKHASSAPMTLSVSDTTNTT